MFNRRTNVALAGNVWCYEQVCLAEMFKLPKMLLANLLIARVSTRFFVWYNYFKNIYTFLLKKFAGVNICYIFTL